MNWTATVKLTTSTCEEWIAATTKANRPDPPEPGDIEATLRKNKLQYTEFSDRMIRAVHGKSRYGEKAATTLFGAIVSPSQEAFTILLYKNGFQKWVWMHNGSVSSEASEAGNEDTSDSSSPDYIYTSRTGTVISRNGGWSWQGMITYNELYKKIKEDRERDKGAFDGEYMMHWVEKTSMRRKRRRGNEGQHGTLTVSDDLGDLMGALDGTNNGEAGGTTVDV